MTENEPDTINPFCPEILRRDEERTIHVSIPLAGITEEQIRFDLEKTLLTLSITGSGRIMKSILQVPCGTRFFKKQSRDGILEIIFEKPLS